MDPHYEAAYKWLQSFHLVGDSLNPTIAVPQFYTEDCEMKFPGQPLLKGHEAIIDFFTNQFSKLDGMHHEIGHVDVLPDRIYLEAVITYIIKGDPLQMPVEVKGLAIFHKRYDEQKMRKFTVYLDPTPLHKRMAYLSGL